MSICKILHYQLFQTSPVWKPAGCIKGWCCRVGWQFSQSEYVYFLFTTLLLPELPWIRLNACIFKIAKCITLFFYIHFVLWHFLLVGLFEHCFVSHWNVSCSLLLVVCTYKVNINVENQTCVTVQYILLNYYIILPISETQGNIFHCISSKG